jgi:uncharacterized protein YbbK (DUF523 family)
VVLVSACLLGQSVRYDGGHCLLPDIWELLAGRPHLALCPELLGGLAVPRPPAQVAGAPQGLEGEAVLAGRAAVRTADGLDLTAAYRRGARRAVELARAAGASEAWLKDRSPACAWDPQGANPRGGPGMGVAAAALARAGIAVRELRARCRGGRAPA